jgi:hypothetical protein
MHVLCHVSLRRLLNGLNKMDQNSQRDLLNPNGLDAKIEVTKHALEGALCPNIKGSLGDGKAEEERSWPLKQHDSGTDAREFACVPRT